MSERIQLTGPPEEAAKQLWAHISEKTMYNGDPLPKFDTPEEATCFYLPRLSEDELEKPLWI